MFGRFLVPERHSHSASVSFESPSGRHDQSRLIEVKTLLAGRGTMVAMVLA